MVSFHGGKRSWLESCRDLCVVLMLFYIFTVIWNGENEVTTVTDHTKWFRAVRTTEGHCKREWWDDEVVSEINCQETWNCMHRKNNTNFTYKMMASKIIAAFQEGFLRFLIDCCMKTPSQCLLLIIPAHWKLGIVRKSVKIKTESSRQAACHACILNVYLHLVLSVQRACSWHRKNTKEDNKGNQMYGVASVQAMILQVEKEMTPKGYERDVLNQ